MKKKINSRYYRKDDFNFLSNFYDILDLKSYNYFFQLEFIS